MAVKGGSSAIEEINEELEVMLSIYSSDGEIVIDDKAQPSYVSIIDIKPKELPLHLTFKIPDGYPSQLPVIEVTFEDVEQLAASDASHSELMEVLYQTAKDNKDSQMMFPLLEAAKEWYHKQDKTLIDESEVKIEKSENKGPLHPDSMAKEEVAPVSEECEEVKKVKKGGKVKGKKSKAQDTSLINTKKPPMKTATDVIKRIMWDPQLDAGHFMVGYLDRFEGIMEQPFEAFDWGDLASADYFALAIPRHRIQYFKYKDEVVWDKTKRLDNVFGSTGSKLTILDVLAKFKKENKSTEEKERCADDEFAESVDVADEEEDVGEKTKPKIPNYFFSIRVTSEETLVKVKEVQSQLLERDAGFKKLLIPPEKLHITLFLLYVDTVEEIEVVLRVLKESQRDLALCLAPVTLINFDHLECWRNQVLVCPVQEAEKLRLQKMTDILVARLRDAGIEIANEDRSFNPHMTLAKKKRSAKVNIGDSFSEVVKQFEGTHFGTHHVDATQLCSRFGKPRCDGFFCTLADVSLNLDV